MSLPTQKSLSQEMVDIRDMYYGLLEDHENLVKQRDRLAEALEIDPYPDEPISDDLHGGNVYCEISVGEMRKIREALQSLTPKDK